MQQQHRLLAVATGVLLGMASGSAIAAQPHPDARLSPSFGAPTPWSHEQTPMERPDGPRTAGSDVFQRDSENGRRTSATRSQRSMDGPHEAEFAPFEVREEPGTPGGRPER